MRIKLIFLSIVSLLVGAGGMGVIESTVKKYSAENKSLWMIYTVIYRPVIRESLYEFYKVYARWPKSIEEVVLKDFLPEWSEIYVPISVSRQDLKKPGLYDRDNNDFVYNSQIGMIARFEISPYKLIARGENLVLRINNPEDPHLFKDEVLRPPK